jgi:hypothetical protein
VNVIGIWQTGFSEPMGIMTNLKAEDELAIYFQRMVIEETFRDLKTLLNFHKLMNKRRFLMEKLASLILDRLCHCPGRRRNPACPVLPRRQPKAQALPGLGRLSEAQAYFLPILLSQARMAFNQLVLPVRTFI